MELSVEGSEQRSGARDLVGTGAASEDGGYLDPSLWTRLAEASSSEAFAAVWLEIQCRMIAGVERAVVVLGPAEKGPFTPVAFWPPESDIDVALSAAAELAMAQRKGSVRSEKRSDAAVGKPLDAVAYPLLVDEQLCGVAAVEIESGGEHRLREAMRQLQWGSAWLETLIRRRVMTPRSRLVTVLELVATCLEHERFQAAATALVTELATLLKCEWASIGFIHGRHTRVRAFSHSAEYGEKTNLIRGIGLAMDEAVDQQVSLVHPPLPDDTPRARHAHAELLKQAAIGALCTVPFGEGDKVLGALVLARPGGETFDARDVELCERIAALAGPVLEIKRRDERWLLRRAWDSARRYLSMLLGRGHVGMKLVAITLLATGIFLSIAEGDYRVSADAVLEGSVQRAVTSPLAGYIAEANVRAGDVIREGQLLGTLEDKDLQLERVKWVSQRAQRLREYSEALANKDRARVRILGAQVAQAETQIELLGEQIARTRMVAPFDGIVVSGDLSQTLSAPVERGQVLFEIAPLDSYRVILKIDERDVSQLQVGQSGQLALTALPGEVLPIVVEKLTPVSIAEEGRNYFRGEARVEEASAQLRPGMEGVGKIAIDRRSLAWIWTHRLTHWMRHWVWSWWP